MADLLNSLRQATADAHEALHVHPALSGLILPDITEDYYLNAIRKFYGFYLPLETAFENSERSLFDGFEPRRASDALAADLARWSIDRRNIPVRPEERKNFTAEESLGFLYLREGSTLGGQQISKALQRHLGLMPGENNHFFQGYGSQTGAHWKSFQNKLFELENKLDHDRVCRFAAELFSGLGNWLKD